MSISRPRRLGALLLLLGLAGALPAPVHAQSAWQRLKAAAARSDSVRRVRADSIARVQADSVARQGSGTPAAVRAQEPAAARSSEPRSYRAQDVQPVTSQDIQPVAAASVRQGPAAETPRVSAPAETPSAAAASTPRAATSARAAAAPSTPATSAATSRAPNFVGTYFSWGIINTKLQILPNGTWRTAQSSGRWTAQGRVIQLDGNARGWCGGRGVLNAEETQLSFDCVSKDGFPMNVSFAKHSKSVER